VTFNSVLHTCVHSGQWRSALVLLAHMHSVGVPATVVTYTTVIAACSNSGRWQEALQLLVEMREQGVQANVATYCAAVRACGAGQQWRAALSLYVFIQALHMLYWHDTGGCVVRTTAAVTAALDAFIACACFI
jgi:pentatricopeptide repeat protein